MLADAGLCMAGGGLCEPGGAGEIDSTKADTALMDKSLRHDRIKENYANIMQIDAELRCMFDNLLDPDSAIG